MQCVERKAQAVLPQQLAAQLLDSKVTGTPEFENKRFLFGEHFLLRQVVWAPALVFQPSDAIDLIPAPPLPRRWSGDAAAVADDAGIAKPLVKPDPTETSSCVHEVPSEPRLAMDLMDGSRRPRLHSHNRIINLKAIHLPERAYVRSPKSKRMSPNPTTNAIESLNAKLRRAVRSGGHFPTEAAALKLLFLVLNPPA